MEKGLRIVQKINWYVLIGAMVCQAALIFSTSADVFARGLKNTSLMGVPEVTEILVVSITFLGLGWTQIKRGHISVEFVYRRLSYRKQRAIDVLRWIVAFLFIIVLSQASWSIAWKGMINQERRMLGGTMFFLWWPGRYILFIGVTALAFVLLTDLIKAIADMWRYSKCRPC